MLPCLALVTCLSATAQTAHYAGVETLLTSTTLTNPLSILVDQSNNVYIVNPGGSNILKETPNGSGGYTETSISTAQTGPPGAAAVDAAGNLYVATGGQSGKLLKLTLKNGAYTSAVIFTSQYPLYGVAVNAAGTALYATNPNGGSIYQFAYVSGSWVQQTTVTSGISSPYGIAIDAGGNWYAAQMEGGIIYKHAPGFSAATFDGTAAVSGTFEAYGIAADAAGDLFITNVLNGSVVKETYVSPSTYTASTLISGFTQPSGVAVDSNGVVYVANTAANTALALNPAAANFGSVAVGTTSAARTLAFVFDTAGNLNGSAPYQALLGGAGNLDYAVVAGSNTTCTGSASEAVNATCTVSLTFTPAYPGLRNGAVLLNGSTGTQAALAYVTGNGTGPQIAFAPVQSRIDGGLYPSAVAVDGGGNVYVTAVGPGQAVKGTYSSGSYTYAQLGSGFQSPAGIAVDGAGNVFIADGNNIYKETNSGGTYTQSTVIQNLSTPQQLWVDGAGNLYIPDSAGRVLKETYNNGTYTQSSIVSSGLSRPSAVTVDAGGTLYIADKGNNQILVETVANGVATLATTIPINAPAGVAVDPSGDVYVVTNNGGVLLVFTNSNFTYAAARTLQSGFLYPTGVAIDGAGTLYVGDQSNGRVVKETVTTPPAITFATTPVGATSTDSPEPVVITNDGNQTLAVSSVGIAAPFAVDASACLPGVPAGGSCTLNYSYTPTQAMGFKYNSQIADNSLNASATQTVVLNGNATKGTQTVTFPQPATSGSYLSNTNIPLNATSNVSGATIRYTVSVTGATGTLQARVSGSNVLQLSGTGSGTIAITATGQSTNNYNASAGVTDSFTATIVSTPATGAGVADTAIGSSSTATVSVQVTTAATLGSIAGLTQGATGLDYAASTASGSCNLGDALAAAQVCSVTVTFSPKFAGGRSGAVELLDASGNILGTTFLSGTGVGPQLAFASTETAPDQGFAVPQGVAVDSNGNIFVADTNNKQLVEEVLTNGAYKRAATPIDTNLNNPLAVAIDGAGNLYVAVYGSAQVVKEVYSKGVYTRSPVAIGAGISPVGVAVDGMGNVFITDESNNGRIYEEIYANGVYTPAAAPVDSTSFKGPQGIKVDRYGNLYVADYAGNTIVKETYANGAYTPSIAVSGLNSPNDVAVDQAGNLYIAESYANVVLEAVYNNGTYTLLPSPVRKNLSNPWSIATGANGNLYIVDGNGGFAVNGEVLVENVTAPPTLTFPSTATGVTSSPLATQITNLGNQPLVFPVPASGLDPQTAANFALETNSDTTCPVVNAGGTAGQIAADTSCTLSYVFAPTAVGTLTSSSILTDNNLNASGALQTITLTGPATQGSQTAQTITFPQPAAVYPGTATLAATASSGLAVSYTLVSGPATLSGSTLTYTAPGTVVVTASQAGNVQYSAAPPVSVSITVTQATAIINWQPSTLSIYTGTALGAGVLNATDSIPATISYTAALRPAGSAVSVNASTALSQGTYNLTALFTPQDALRYGIVSDTVLFSVQNMNVFVAGKTVANSSTGNVLSLFNNGTTQSAATSGGGTGAAVDAGGYVWSIDSGGAGLSKFTDAGTFSASYSPPGITGATALAIDGNSNLIVANGNGVLSVVSNAGAAVSSIAGSTTSAPSSVAIDISGNVWVANPAANTVDEIIGGAAPASPLATAVQNNTPGTRP